MCYGPRDEGVGSTERPDPTAQDRRMLKDLPVFLYLQIVRIIGLFHSLINSIRLSTIKAYLISNLTACKKRK